MSSLLINQLRFTRGELQRALDGVDGDDACRRFEPMNCISWIVGHLAAQEHFFWVFMAQGRQVANDEMLAAVAHGQPASTPSLNEMWSAWRTITAAADAYLDTLNQTRLATHLEWQGQPWSENIGTMLLRNVYHYWFHIGEAYAIRQLLGHQDLPEFVGDMAAAVYRSGGE